MTILPFGVFHCCAYAVLIKRSRFGNLGLLPENGHNIKRCCFAQNARWQYRYKCLLDILSIISDY